MTQEECFELGYLLRPHGLAGHMLLVLDVDEPAAYRKLEAIWVETREGLAPLPLEGIRVLPGSQAIITITGINSVEEAATLKGRKVYLPLTDLPTLPEGKFYFHQLTGLEVYDLTDDRVLGPIAQVYEMPQQTLLGVIVDGREALVPLHDDFIDKIDVAGGRLTMRLPEGLLALYLGGDTDTPDDQDEDADTDPDKAPNGAPAPGGN